MYRRSVTLLITIAFSLCFFWLFQSAFLKKSDLEKTAALIEQNQKIATTKSHSIANQKRKGIRKDIWFTQEDGTRLQYRIESKTSILAWSPKGANNKVNILEHLQGVQCWMQDRLYINNGAPMQQLRFFEANEGSYQLTNQEFIANTVNLSLLRVNGHELSFNIDPKKGFLRGIAKEVSFSVEGKNPHFQADQFQAMLGPQQQEGKK